MRAFLTFLAGFGGFIFAAFLVGGGFLLRDYYNCDKENVSKTAPQQTIVVHESRQELLRPEHLDTGAPGATSVAPKHFVTTEMVSYDAQSTIQSDWKFVDPYAGVSGTFSIHPNAPLPVLVAGRETLGDGSKIVVFRGYAHQEQSRVGLFGTEDEETTTPEQAAAPSEPSVQATPAAPVQPIPQANIAPLPAPAVNPTPAAAQPNPPAAKPAAVQPKQPAVQPVAPPRTQQRPQNSRSPVQHTSAEVVAN